MLPCRALVPGLALIVAAGGDGTINVLVNGIAPAKCRELMAIIPAGLTKAYARALRISRAAPVVPARVILMRQTLAMDIGQANHHYFKHIAAGGLFAE